MSQLTVRIISDFTELESLKEQWEALAETASQPNIFYHPLFFLPAAKQLGWENVCVAVIQDGEEILGFFPWELRRNFLRIPFRYYSSWHHRHCFLCTPLVRRGREAEVMETLFRYAKAHRGRFSILRFVYINGDSTVSMAIDSAAHAASASILKTMSTPRPALNLSIDSSRNFENYLNSILPKKRQKQFNKKRAELAEFGAVTLETLDTSPARRSKSACEEWVQTFLDMEHAGWKGKNGSSLKSNPAHAEFFRQVVLASFERGQLLFQSLCINSHPISMQCTFISQSTGFAFKIAFNEDYSKQSPGYLLEFDSIRYILSNNAPQIIDTCADSDSQMLNSTYRDRMEIESKAVFFKRWQFWLAQAVMKIRSKIRSRGSVKVQN